MYSVLNYFSSFIFPAVVERPLGFFVFHDLISFRVGYFWNLLPLIRIIIEIFLIFLSLFLYSSCLIYFFRYFSQALIRIRSLLNNRNFKNL
jgi:hypothetical protein